MRDHSDGGFLCHASKESSQSESIETKIPHRPLKADASMTKIPKIIN